MIFERVAAAVLHSQIVADDRSGARLDVKGDAILSAMSPKPIPNAQPDRSKSTHQPKRGAGSETFECGLARIWTDALGIAPLGVK